jgi:hypothetical protein
MVSFRTILQKFDAKGEKTGWTYILISNKISQKICPDEKRSYRVKGLIDELKIKKQALIPMGDGNFILSVNAEMRKALRKHKGAEVSVKIEHDDSPLVLSQNLVACLKDSPEAHNFFKTLSKSHQMYFSKWIESAKTEPTKTRRLAMTINALEKGWGFPGMLRASKSER